MPKIPNVCVLLPAHASGMSGSLHRLNQYVSERSRITTYTLIWESSTSLVILLDPAMRRYSKDRLRSTNLHNEMDAREGRDIVRCDKWKGWDIIDISAPIIMVNYEIVKGTECNYLHVLKYLSLKCLFINLKL